MRMKLLARLLAIYFLVVIPAVPVLAAAFDPATSADCPMHAKESNGHHGHAADCCDDAAIPAPERAPGGNPCPCGPGFACHAATGIALPAARVHIAAVVSSMTSPPRTLLLPPQGVDSRRWRPPALI